MDTIDVQQEKENDLKLSFVPEIISMVFLITYFFLICPFRYFKFKKDIEQAEGRSAKVTSRKILQYGANNTIFEYLDALAVEDAELHFYQTRESTQSQTKSQEIGDFEQPNQVLQRKLHKKAKTQNIQQYHQMKFESKQEREFSGAVICDCYECCCQGCPWQLDKSNSVYAFFDRNIERFQKFFFVNQKLVAYIIVKVGSFSYLPLNNILYFSRFFYLTFIGGVIFNCLEFYVLVFTLSFINTRREMVRLEKHNQIQRALLIYYHLKKALVFTVIFFSLQLVVTYIIYNIYGNEDDFIQRPFFYLNFSYNIVANILLLCVLKYSGCLSNDLISDDDRILKAQQRLYAIQNNLLKYFPSEEVWLSYLANQLETRQAQEEGQFSRINSVEMKNQLKIVLEQNCLIAKDKLQAHIHVVENQKFKKIKKNLGTQRCQITFLTIYLYFHCIALLSLSLVLAYLFISTSNQNQNATMTQSMNQRITWLAITYFSMVTLQYTLLPYLIGVMCNKKALLGQDYGQKYNTGDPTSTTSDIVNQQSFPK